MHEVVKFRSKGVLEAWGVPISRVVQVARFDIDRGDSSRMFEVKRCLTELGLPNKHIDSRAVGETLMSGNLSDSSHLPFTIRPSLRDTLDWVRMLLRGGAIDTVSRDESSVSVRIWNKCKGRSLFVTEDERIGLGPEFTKEGDLVTVLLNCDPAMLLRPASSRENGFEVVGEAYCHGIMRGEALLGRLPDGWDKVYISTANGHFGGFTHRESGHTQLEDPRLASYPLPEHWTREMDEEFTWFVRDDGAQTTETRDDPRITIEFLKERGVNLQAFNLV